MANAVSAAALLDTLGINTHLDFDAYGYQNLATVESNINYLGVKIIRDSAETATDAQTWLAVSQATGAKFDDYIAETSPAGMATDLGFVQQLAKEGILASVEGGDEEDDAYPASLGNTLQITAQFQQQLYALGQELGLPVINMSFGAGWTAANDWEGDYGTVGNLAAYATDANAHTYPGAGQLPDEAIQQLNTLAGMAASGQPVITTEIGWSTSVFSETAIAKYVLDAVHGRHQGRRPWNVFLRPVRRRVGRLGPVQSERHPAARGNGAARPDHAARLIPAPTRQASRPGH